MRTTLGASLVSGALAGVLWIVISFATGGTVVFSLVGGILLGVLVFAVGYGFRRLIWEHRRPPA